MRRVLYTWTRPIRVSSDDFVGLCYDAYRANKNICTTMDDLMEKQRTRMQFLTAIPRNTLS